MARPDRPNLSNIPANVLDAIPKTAKLRNELQGFHDEVRSVNATLGRYQFALAQAQDQDNVLYAASMREGRSDVGTPNADVVEKERADSLRRHEALETAIAQVNADLLKLVTDGAERAIEPLVTAEQAAREAFRVALSALRAALDEARRTSRATSYVRYVVEHDALPASPKIGRGYHAIADLAAKSEPINTDAILAGLARLIDPPEPPKKAPVQPLADRHTGIVPDVPDQPAYEPDNAKWLAQHRLVLQSAPSAAMTTGR